MIILLTFTIDINGELMIINIQRRIACIYHHGSHTRQNIWALEGSFHKNIIYLI
jgi:hypothetical protein